MKLDIGTVPGKVSHEVNSKCEIFRCIYYFQKPFPNNCLLRIYKFKNKTIVIASQLIAPVRWDEHLIQDVIEDFEIDCENLYWINHVGLFSDYMPAKEEFVHTTFAEQREFIFAQKQVNLIEETEISLESVENLIESSLEPVDSWLELDLETSKNLQRVEEEKIVKLLHLYIKSNLDYLSEHETIKKALVQLSLYGAIFFYPNQERRIEFARYSDIEASNNELRKKALRYIQKSFPNEDLVICVCLDDFSPFCTILPRKVFIDKQVTTSLESIEKSIECELEISHTIEFELENYQIYKQNKQERINSLLNLYLKSNLSYYISRFEEERLIDESLINKSDSETTGGALFYYPKHDYCEFSSVSEFLDMSKKSAIPYIKMHDVETEVVICVCLNEYQSICGIFSKELANNKLPCR